MCGGCVVGWVLVVWVSGEVDEDEALAMGEAKLFDKTCERRQQHKKQPTLVI